MDEIDERLINKCINLRHDIHKYPEISGCETETKNRLISFISENTHLKIQDMGKWFYAVYESGKKVPGILFRAELDAVAIQETGSPQYKSLVPGVGHL